jgi:hypothetical protein
MEVRVARLEEVVPRIESRLDRMDGRLDAVGVRLRGVEQAIARLEGKVDILASQIIAKLPSWWQMPAVIGATVSLLIGFWALVQYMRAHGLL